MDARETPRANHQPSGYFWVTETDAEICPHPDGPLGLEGGVTNTGIIDRDLRGRTTTLLRPKLLSRKQRTRIGTWNVRTMYGSGKVHQVASEMKRLGLAILGVSETRWTGTGKVQLVSGETILYSGATSIEAPHEKGVALILSKQASKSLTEWEPISERIINARFESRCQNTTIIQVYAPPNDADEDDKDNFYHQLVIASANRYEVLYNVDDDNNMTKLDLEEDWRGIKEMHTSTCEEVLGKVKQERKE